MTLLICRTCPRYDRQRSGTFGQALKDAVINHPDDIPVRSVTCLAGCPDDGVVALDGPTKFRVRFTGLSSNDAPAVIAAALAHAGSLTGDPTDWAVPPEIADRIGSITSKRHG